MAIILLIDDDDLVRETMGTVLRNANHEVLEATDGRHALDVLGHDIVDLLITDIVMPELDGIGLIREIRKRFPGLHVIAISGGGRQRNLDYLEVAQKLGAEFILPKPFLPRRLLAAVETVLNPPVQPFGMDQ